MTKYFGWTIAAVGLLFICASGSACTTDSHWIRASLCCLP
jgi:hypothetical protein